MLKLSSTGLRRPSRLLLTQALAGLALLTVSARPVLAQTPTFAPVTTYSTGANNYPYSVALGDVNGDGRPDIVSANGSSSTAGVFLGQANGGFASMTAYSTGAFSYPRSVALGDVNGDGRLDIVTANSSRSEVGVLLGQISGGFAPVTAYSVGATSYPSSVTLGDVNGDGRLDIVTANGNSSTVGVLLGQAGGGFAPVTIYSTGASSNPNSVTLGDVNGDGQLDIVTANTDAGTAGVLLGQTRGSFGSVTAYSTGANSAPHSVTLGDVNGDGRLDIVTANSNTATAGVLLGQTSGGFGPVTTYSTGGFNSPYSASLGDMNGDGRLDIVTANNGTSTAGVLLGQVGGTFGPATNYSTGGQPWLATLGDVNSDGRLDIVTANIAAFTTGVLLNTTIFAPTLTSLSPTSRTTGASITLTGTNLTGATGVSFNGTAATTFAVVNATTVTVTVPAGATSGNVTVTTPGGTSNGLPFTVAPTTNNALAFDGVNNYVALPTGLNTANFTFETWINYQNNGAFTRIFDFGTGANTWMILSPRSSYSFNSGNIFFGIVTNRASKAEETILTPTPMPTGWHHVAVTLATSGATTSGTLYLDGNVIGTNPGMTISPASLGTLANNWLGRSQYATDPYLKASLDEVHIYSAALTQANIRADMFSTSTSVPASQVAYYNFDQGLAGGNNAGITNLTDQSGNGNTGTLTNFALTGTTSNFVRSFPTITGISPTSGPRGSSVLIAGTNLLDATGFKFNGTAVTPFTTPTNDLSATVTVPNAATTGPVSTASANLTAYNGPVFTLVTDLVVSTGTQLSPTLSPAGTYNSITVTGTGNGVLAGNVSVATFFTVQPGGGLSDGCSIISGAGTFTLGAGSILGICNAAGITGSGATGAVQVTGTRLFSPGASYGYNTSAAVTGNGLPGTVANLAINTAGNVTLTGPVAITVAVGVGGAGNLVLGGNTLTLLSNAVNTALAVNTGTGAVVGTATVQRYIDPTTNAGLGYRHYSAPVNNTTVADLATPGTPGTPGFTPEVSQAAAYNASATPGTTTPFPTVFGYDQSRVTLTNAYAPFDRGFVVPAALTTPLAVGQGYVVNIAGNQLVDFVGTLTTGDQSPVALSRVAGNPDAG